jgi:hypothetical protein
MAWAKPYLDAAGAASQPKDRIVATALGDITRIGAISPYVMVYDYADVDGVSAPLIQSASCFF